MKFDRSSRVEYSAREVLETMIERMEVVVPFLQNIDSVETLETDRRPDGKIRVVRRWQANNRTAPLVLRPFLTKKMLSWIDDSLWTPDQFRAEWSLETSMSNVYACTGATTCAPHPDDPETATDCHFEGDIKVHPDKVPGIPTFLGKRLAPQIEKWVVRMVTPNVTELAQGLQAYLDYKYGKGPAPDEAAVEAIARHEAAEAAATAKAEEAGGDGDDAGATEGGEGGDDAEREQRG